MRVTVLLTTLLALALFVAGCGGPDDPDAQLAAACERQIEEIENAVEESETPIAPSTQERLDATTLVECAGQEVEIVSAGEAADTAAEEGDGVKDESGTAKEEEAEEAADEAPAEEEPAAEEEAAPAELDPEARETFVTTCGGCHTLSDAGTSGAVGPNLDDSKPDAEAVATIVEEGSGAMPAGLLSGDDLDAVATYVASAAGN